MVVVRVVILYLLVTVVNVCAMQKSLYEFAYEEHMKERKEAFEKLGEPVPDGPTFKEAMLLHVINQATNFALRINEAKMRELDDKSNEWLRLKSENEIMLDRVEQQARKIYEK
jgi:hypothetical protein